MSAHACLDLPTFLGNDVHVTETPRERLARLMEDRRRELGLTWDEIAFRGSTHAETLRQVRKGERRIRPITRRAIEVGFAWTEGSVERILQGGDPTPVQPSLGHAGSHDQEDRDQRIAHLAEDIKEVLDDETLPAEARYAIAEMLMEEWKKEELTASDRRRAQARQAKEVWKRAKSA